MYPAPCSCSHCFKELYVFMNLGHISFHFCPLYQNCYTIVFFIYVVRCDMYSYNVRLHCTILTIHILSLSLSSLFKMLPVRVVFLIFCAILLFLLTFFWLVCCSMWPYFSPGNYRKVSNIRRTISQNLNNSRLVLHLSLPHFIEGGF